MDPGDSWSSDTGFELAGVDWYADRAGHLEELAAQVTPKIADQTVEEKSITLDFADFAAYFDGFMHAFPPGVLRRVLHRPVVFEVPSSPLPFWVLDFSRGAVYRLSAPPPDTASIVSVNEGVLADAIAKRLVHVVHGSMRIHVHLRPGGVHDDLMFWGLVVPWELGYVPLRRILRPRLAEVAWRRRGEGLELLDAAAGAACSSSALRIVFGTEPTGSRVVVRVADMAAPKSFFLTPEIHEYVVAHGTPPDAVQQALIAETAELADGDDADLARAGRVHDPADTRALGVRQAVEVGTFTGYSALAIARGLPDDGHLLCCDVSEEWTSIGRTAWAEAGVDDKIELVIAPAADTLRALPDDEYVDLAFIDADKPSYPVYYEELLRRLRPNGLILVDNTLWGGAIVDASNDDESTVAIRAFNDMVAADARVEHAAHPRRRPHPPAQALIRPHPRTSQGSRDM